MDFIFLKTVQMPNEWAIVSIDKPLTHKQIDLKSKIDNQVPTGAFSHVQSLRSLLLEENPMSKLHPRAFRPLSQLVALRFLCPIA